MHSLESFKSPSENELCLTYNISQPGEGPYRVAVSLLFVPNTHRLAEARVNGLQADVGDVVEVFINYFSLDISVQGPTGHVLWPERHVLLDFGFGPNKTRTRSSIRPTMLA